MTVAHTLSTEGRVGEKYVQLEYMKTELKYLKPKNMGFKPGINLLT